MTAKYMVGATVVVASVLPEINKPIREIAVYYRRAGESMWSLKVPSWYINAFVAEVDGLEAETQYEFFSRVFYNDGTSTDSPERSFKTLLFGNVTYSLSTTDRTTGQTTPAAYLTTIRNDMDIIVNNLNAVGFRYNDKNHAIPVTYDSSAGTAAASYNSGVLIGKDYAKATTQLEERLSAYTHELRHYFGISQLGLGFTDHISERIANHREIIAFFTKNSAFQKTAIGNAMLYDYMIDNVYRFMVGSDIAFACRNYEHSSLLNGTETMQYFMHAAIWASTVMIHPEYGEAAHIPIIEDAGDEGYVPNVYSNGKGSIRSSKMIDASLQQYVVNATFGSGVTSLGDNALARDSTIESVSSDYITSIGKYAFGGCANLRSINLSKLETVGETAFNNCNNISSLDFPETAKVFGDYCFRYMAGLTDVTFRSPTMPTFGRNVFSIPRTATLHVPAELLDAYRTKFGSDVVAIV